MAARADLARQRQLMRVKPATTATGNKKKTVKKEKSEPTRETELSSSAETVAPTTVKRRTSNATSTTKRQASALGSANMALVVRQVLQRQHYGEPGEYVRATGKDELFRLLTQVAQHAYELREQQQAEKGAMQEESERMERRAHDLAGRMLELEAKLHDSEREREQLDHRLRIGSDEYSAVVDTLRKYEAKWGDTQATMAQQQQLLQEMSRSLDERTAQVDAQAQEMAVCRAALAEAQQELTEYKNQLQVHQIEIERAQKQLADERRENKAVLWELQNKSRDFDDINNQLDDAKDRIVTLEGQIQMELIARKSLVQERDAVQLLHHREREEWKHAEVSRGEADHRRAQEYRSMDLELRQLRQAVGRLRTDLEAERSQREKAESTALRATDIADELKAAGKALQVDVQRLATELQEERAVRESKEGALTLAYRELQSLQKRVREEETARQDAQNEVDALAHRMKLIRREHLTMLHRVETPPQLAARWKEPPSAAHHAPPSS